MLKTDCIRVTIWRDRRLVDAFIYGRDADEGNKRVNTSGFAARLILEDEARLGRRRARSGAEKILRAAGFSDPSRTYAFACDYIGRHALRAAA